jgi:hypothetical protein
MDARLLLGDERTITPSMKLCCQVNSHFKCLYCEETLCHDCGKKYGLARHFIIHQCRKRYTMEQQKKWSGGAPKTSSPWRRFRQGKLDRTLYRPEVLGHTGLGRVMASYNNMERTWLALPSKRS